MSLLKSNCGKYNVHPVQNDKDKNEQRCFCSQDIRRVLRQGDYSLRLAVHFLKDLPRIPCLLITCLAKYEKIDRLAESDLTHRTNIIHVGHHSAVSEGDTLFVKILLAQDQSSIAFSFKFKDYSSDVTGFKLENPERCQLLLGIEENWANVALLDERDYTLLMKNRREGKQVHFYRNVCQLCLERLPGMVNTCGHTKCKECYARWKPCATKCPNGKDAISFRVTDSFCSLHGCLDRKFVYTCGCVGCESLGWTENEKGGQCPNCREIVDKRFKIFLPEKQ